MIKFKKLFRRSIDTIRRMGICMDDTCRACGFEVETMKHLLCDCDVLAVKRMGLLGSAYPEPEDYRHLPLKGVTDLIDHIFE